MRYAMRFLVALMMLAVIADQAGAQRRGGGGRGGGGRGGGFRGGGGGFSGGGGVRSVARPSVTRPSGGFGGGVAARPGGVPGRTNISGGEVYRGNVNRAAVVGNRTDINNVDINRNWDAGDAWGGCCYHPVARAAAYTAGAAITAAAIGSTYYTLPSNCTTTTINGVTYEQCGSTWLQPQFEGTSATYVVVNPP